MFMTTVFIGMPIYNGARFIRPALESLCNQTYRNWRLFISDNCSTDATGEICREFVQNEPRITYVKHPVNRGIVENFGYVLDQADLKYFMWAASNDMWDPGFLASCVGNLEKDNRVGIAFTGVYAIDTYGRVIRGCPTLPSLSGYASYKTIYRYLMDPEINGKANLIHGVYRLELCKAAWAATFKSGKDVWGQDMCFVLAALSRRGAIVDERVLFHKRYVRADDTPEKVNRIELAKHRRLGFPRREFAGYLRGNLAAVRGTRFYWLTLAVLLFRMFNPVQSRGF